MEIVSLSACENDNGDKRHFYANFGVLEYGRFDEEYSEASVRLPGEMLGNKESTPLEVVSREEGLIEGYSPVLNLCLRWDEGPLQRYDTAGRKYIATAAVEREYRRVAEARADQERQQSEAAEARVQELKSQISQLPGEG